MTTDLFDTQRQTTVYETLDHDVRKSKTNLQDAASRRVFADLFATSNAQRSDDRRFQAELCAAVRATGSGCTGYTDIDGHSHYLNGTCDDEVPYAQGGPA